MDDQLGRAELLRQAEGLRDRVDQSRASLDGPTEDEEALLARAEALEVQALLGGGA